MKSIFFIHLLNDFSGSPRVLRDAIEACEGMDNTELHILSSRSNGFLNGVNALYHFIPYATNNNKFIQLVSYLTAQVFLFFRLSFLLIVSKVHNNESIVICNTLLPFGGGLAGLLFSNRTISYLHETHIRPKLLNIFLKFLVIFYSDTVIYVSNYVKNELNLGVSKEIILYNGLRGDFKRHETDFKRKFDSRIILFVGSLKEYKGIFNFIKLAENMPNFKFVAIFNATDDDYISFLNKYKYTLQRLENLTTFLRPDEIQVFYENASLVMNLSDPKKWVETFGLTLIEGMFFGCPIIAPPYGGPKEIIDSSTGKLIEPDDFDSIEDYICYLFSDFKLWLGVSKNCIEKASLFDNYNYRSGFRKIISNR